MGYRGHENWHDMSHHVVHFTRALDPQHLVKPQPPEDPKRWTLRQFLAEIRYIGQQDPTGYHPWMQILGEGLLRPGDKPLGAARRVPEVEHLHRVVCFSEIPLDMLDRLIERRSLYGIGFNKGFLVSKGGAPLWYLDKEGDHASIIRAQIEERVAAGVDPNDPFWRLMPFIDNPGNYSGRLYRFEWEREWRVIGEMSFQQGDVAFLFLPEEDHDRARQFFADVEVENSGPAYFCPYIDARWDMNRIQEALKNVPPPPPPSQGATPWWDDPF